MSDKEPQTAAEIIALELADAIAQLAAAEAASKRVDDLRAAVTRLENARDVLSGKATARRRRVIEDVPE